MLSKKKRKSIGYINDVLRIKNELEKLAEQTGGKYIDKVRSNMKLKDDYILRTITNPIFYNYKQKKYNQLGGSINIQNKIGWVKDNSLFLFKDYNFNEMKNLANNWGINNTKKYKSKESLANALKILILFKNKKIINPNHLETVAKNYDINPYNININNLHQILHNKLKKIPLI